jgi:tRNA/tmRNA/rRNA uracil-C5-methylase (TrmA/RlmC/RlmD family)
MLQPQSEITLTIEKPVSGGRMLARHERQIVLVSGAIPGEHVRARVERVTRQVAFAETVEVLEKSGDRRDAAVDWKCGGSLYAHVAYERQLQLKSDVIGDAFARIARMPLDTPVPVMGSREDGYRMRARLHAANGKFGFFREGTHEPCDPAPTRQLLATTLEALNRLQSALPPATAIACEIVENCAADERAVLVETAAEPMLAPVAPIEGITGLLFSDHTRAHLSASYGSPFVTDRIPAGDASVELTHHVQSFFQGNRYLLPQLVERVLNQVPDGTVTDLYAGVGLFAVSLAARKRGSVVAVEGDRSSGRDLDANAAVFGDGLRVEQMSVERYLRRRGVQRPDTLVVDPPRTGLSPEARSGILALRAPRIVYVSCDPATLARDVRTLVDTGYCLDHLEAFDLFPNTAHVETLAVMVR